MKYFYTLIFSVFTMFTYAQSDYVWEEFKNPKTLNKDNAGSIKSFENTPESLVCYFYASKIRQDDKWKEVLPDPSKWSERLKHKIKTYENWKITEFRLVSKTEYEDGKVWVKIYMTLEIDGKTESGTDEATVELINGKWVITSVPT